MSAGGGCVLHSTGGDVTEELTIVRDLQRQFADGLILVSLRMTEMLAAEVDRAPVPVVVIGRASQGARVDTVQTDSRVGAAEAVRHLYGAGRRRIAFVNGPSETLPGKMRLDGYADGLRACRRPTTSASSRSPRTSRSSPDERQRCGCWNGRGRMRSSARTI